MKKDTKISLKKILLIAGLSASSILSYAQYAYNYLKAADDYYRKGDYFSAAQYYEKYLNGKTSGGSASYNPYNAAGKPKDKQVKNVSREDIVYKTGESYQLLNNYVKAEPFFKEATAASSRFPLARYWYAKSLKANSKFEEAETEFNTFLQEYTTDDNFKQDASKELKNLQFRSAELKKNDLALYSINKMGMNKAATSAPAKEGSVMVFSSTRPLDSGSSKSPYINRLYEGDFSGSSANKLDVPQGKDEHLEGATFTADGNKMFVTKWSMKDNKKAAAIYMATKQSEGKWSDPVMLDNNVNTAGYNSQQPFLTADGSTLYYSSNKPGGTGGFDIWMAPIGSDGKPGASVNLGSTVNSTFDEYAPYYHEGSKSLVFSGNGRIGLGGFDFFVTKNVDGNWQEPVNMGYPINSVKDEIYLMSTSQKYLTDTFYFSSDRASECCLEMFAANKMRAKKRVSGIIIDCLTGRPMSRVTISMVEDPYNNATIPNPTTTASGKYEILLDEYQPFRIKAEAPGYIPKEIVINRVSQEDTLINETVCLEQPGKKPFEAENKPVVIENIYFDYDSSTLKPESFPVLDSVTGLMQRYPTMVIEVSGHTDSKGSVEHNRKLSNDRAKAFVDYVASKGVDASRMKYKGYGATRPIAPNNINGKDNPEGRAKNRRTEIKVLNY